MLLPSVPLDAIRQPAFVYTAEGRIVAANGPIQALAGRSLAGCTATEILATFRNRHPDGTPFLPHESPLSRALRDEETTDVPMTITADDGREHHLLVSASPLRDGGRITAALVVWQDVTGIRRAEAALAEREDLFRRTFDQSPVAAALLLPDFTLLRSNTALCQMLGYSEAELQRMLFSEFTHPDDVDVDVRLATELASGAIDQYELDKRFIRKDGAIVWGHLSVRYVRDAEGRVMYLLPMVQDITERKQAEAALRESEAKYRRFVDDDITSQFISAPDGRVLDCNPAFARMFGFASVEEARSASAIDTYDAPSERESLLDRLRREGRLENEERFRRRRDGTKIHVVENLIGDFDEGGELVRIRGYMRDDTQRYLAEKALREREQTLQGIFRAAPVGIGMVSHRTITQANDQLCRMTGYIPRRTDRPRRADLLPERRGVRRTSGGRSTRRSMRTGSGPSRRSGGGRTAPSGISCSVRRRSTSPAPTRTSSSTPSTSRGCGRASGRWSRTWTTCSGRTRSSQRFAYVASHDLQEPLRSIVSFSPAPRAAVQGTVSTRTPTSTSRSSSKAVTGCSG